MNIDDIIENARLKGRVIALEAEVQTLQAEVRCLEAVIRSHERVDCLTVASLKAEVERLESDLKLEKENEDRLVRYWQTANNEVHGQATQIAALIDNQTRLKAEVENSNRINTELLLLSNQQASEVRRLSAEVERLKAMDSLKTVSLTNSTNWQAIGDYAEAKEESARLKAEVERLRKAGTYLCSTMEVNGIHDNGDISMHERAIALWNAAKEGKQS